MGATQQSRENPYSWKDFICFQDPLSGQPHDDVAFTLSDGYTYNLQSIIFIAEHGGTSPVTGEELTKRANGELLYFENQALKNARTDDISVKHSIALLNEANYQLGEISTSMLNVAKQKVSKYHNPRVIQQHQNNNPTLVGLAYAEAALNENHNINGYALTQDAHDCELDTPALKEDDMPDFYLCPINFEALNPDNELYDATGIFADGTTRVVLKNQKNSWADINNPDIEFAPEEQVIFPNHQLQMAYRLFCALDSDLKHKIVEDKNEKIDDDCSFDFVDQMLIAIDKALESYNHTGAGKDRADKLRTNVLGAKDKNEAVQILFDHFQGKGYNITFFRSTQVKEHSFDTLLLKAINNDDKLLGAIGLNQLNLETKTGRESAKLEVQRNLANQLDFSNGGCGGGCALN